MQARSAIPVRWASIRTKWVKAIALLVLRGGRVQRREAPSAPRAKPVSPLCLITLVSTAADLTSRHSSITDLTLLNQVRTSRQTEARNVISVRWVSIKTKGVKPIAFLVLKGEQPQCWGASDAQCAQPVRLTLIVGVHTFFSNILCLFTAHVSHGHF